MSQQMHEVQKAYDDRKFTMVYHDDHEYVIAHCKTVTFVVWMALLKRASKKDSSCFPSLQTIANESGVSKRTVISAITELAEHEMVTVTKRLSDTGDYTSNLYRLHRAPGARGSAGDSPPGSASGAPRVVHDVHTNNTQGELEPKTEPYLSDRAEISRRRNLERAFDVLWSTYPRKEHKAAALKAWIDLDPDEDLIDMIHEAVRDQSQNNWAGREMRYIPLLASWLRGERWEDGIVSPAQTNGTVVRTGKHGQRVYSPDEVIARAVKEMSE